MGNDCITFGGLICFMVRVKLQVIFKLSLLTLLNIYDSATKQFVCVRLRLSPYDLNVSGIDRISHICIQYIFSRTVVAYCNS